MNETADKQSVIEIQRENYSRRGEVNALPVPANATPMGMLALAVQQGADLTKIEKLMELHQRWEADEARKAFNQAFATFKAEAIEVIKNKQVTDGPLKGKSYAELHSVVNAVTPALSENGLGASWKLTKDEKDWLEVTCTLRHSLGHSESVSMGGPPDTGGAKSAIQARASSISYLERYTLKAICGVAEQGEDDDGGSRRGMPDNQYVDFDSAIDAETDAEQLATLWSKIAAACSEHKDRTSYEEFKKKIATKGAALKAKK